MATFNAPALSTMLPAGATGKLNAVTRSITGDGAGGTVAAASVLRMMELPAHIRVHDVVVWPSAATSSLTCKAGYTDQETGGTVTDDDAFIAASTSIATAAARVRMNTAGSPVELRKRTFLDITTAGATMAADTVLNCTVLYEYLGTP